MTDREMLIQMWDEMWGSYTWIPAWAKSFSDLTPQQAAWKAGPGRVSIWQHLNHVAFWRETTLARLAGKPPTDDVITRGNLEEPTEVTDAAWRASVARLERSHQAL